jgi:glycerate kinase
VIVKIICAPDSFKDCLPASSIASAMQAGIRRALPDAVIDLCPVADGGEGTADIVAAAIAATPHSLRVRGPLGDPVDAVYYLAHDQRLAILDMASAAGLMLIPRERRDVMRSSTFGVGQLLLAACTSGAQRVIVGVGGSASNDGGCGMAQALGIRFLDNSGRTINAAIGGADLPAIASIDLSQVQSSIEEIDIVVACDVDNVLTGDNGAAKVYAAQKGASEDQIAELERGLVHLAATVSRDTGTDLADISRAGAAGGLAGGLLVFAGATLASGIDIVLRAVGFDQRVGDCDLCLTGEGRLDRQSLAGKACLGVARRAAGAGVACVALVGSVGAGAEETLRCGLSSYELIGPGLTAAESMRQAEGLIADAAERVVAQYLQQSL